LVARQTSEAKLLQRQIASLDEFMSLEMNTEIAAGLGLPDRRTEAAARLVAARSPERIRELEGTIGLDPACLPAK
jgi:hypothetical protein